MDDIKDSKIRLIENETKKADDKPVSKSFGLHTNPIVKKFWDFNKLQKSDKFSVIDAFKS